MLVTMAMVQVSVSKGLAREQVKGGGERGERGSCWRVRGHNKTRQVAVTGVLLCYVVRALLRRHGSGDHVVWSQASRDTRVVRMRMMRRHVGHVLRQTLMILLGLDVLLLP